MRRWTLAGMPLLLLAMGLSEVFGNMGPLPWEKEGWDQGKIVLAPLPAREVKLVVKVDEKAKTPRLQVPYNLFLDPIAPPAVAPKRGVNAGRFGLPTIVSGVALTLAFVVGGLWLARRRWGRLLGVVLILSLSATGTALLWANAPPPPLARPAEAVLPALKLPAGIELTDKLLLEPVLTADHLTLIVPKSMLK